METHQILSGFTFNLDQLITTLPEAKIEVATLQFAVGFDRMGAHPITLLGVHQLRGQLAHFQPTNDVWKSAQVPIGDLLEFPDEQGMYVRRPEPTVWVMFWTSMGLIQTSRQSDEERWLYLNGRSSDYPNHHDAYLFHLEGRAPCGYLRTPHYPGRNEYRGKKQDFRISSDTIRSLIGQMDYQVAIGECELAVAAIALLLWSMYSGFPIIIILCADNANVSLLFGPSKSQGMVSRKVLKRIIHFCIEKWCRSNSRLH